MMTQLIYRGRQATMGPLRRAVRMLRPSFVAVTLLLLAFALCAGVPASTGVPALVGDDLSQALANHGMSQGDSLLAASAIEFLIANNKALLDRIAADEDQIAALSKTR